MKNILRFLVIFFLSTNFHACAQPAATPVKVEIRQENGAWQLYRGGEPYYIKGAGGRKHLDKAVASGANSVRTWGSDQAIAILDSAHARGLTVLFGLWVGCERHGFDYNDAGAVKAQLKRFTEIVKTYKDHPAILMWGIGNEVDLSYSNLKVWDAINDIAAMIHKIDPNHPTVTVTAGLDAAEVRLIKERAPHIDVFGVNMYGNLTGIDKRIREYGWDGPYMITEWGPDGHWQVPKTSWGVPIEQTSSEKAVVYQKRYEEGILADKEKCIGSYVFLWGQKQETTPTWYGLFLADGAETGAVDAMELAWSGKEPANRAPRIKSFLLESKKANENIYLRPGQQCRIETGVEDPDGDALQYGWEVLPESKDIKSGGDRESKPKTVPIQIEKSEENGRFHFEAPLEEGPYRLFTYIYDGKGKVATANIPFYIKK